MLRRNCWELRATRSLRAAIGEGGLRDRGFCHNNLKRYRLIVRGDLIFAGNEHFMLIAGEFSELINIVPDLGSNVCKDMRAITVVFKVCFLN